jgi:hypothetical protein
MPYAPATGINVPQSSGGGGQMAMSMLQWFSNQKDKKEDELKRENSAGKSADAWFSSLPEDKRPLDPIEFKNMSARDKAGFMQGKIAAQAFEGEQARIDADRQRMAAETQRIEAIKQELGANRGLGAALAGAGDPYARFGLQLENPQGPWSPEVIAGAPRDNQRALLESLAQNPEAASARNLPALLDSLAARNNAGRTNWALAPGQELTRGGRTMVAVSPNSFQVLDDPTTRKPAPIGHDDRLYSEDLEVFKGYLKTLPEERRDQAIATRIKMRQMEGSKDSLMDQVMAAGVAQMFKVKVPGAAAEPAPPPKDASKERVRVIGPDGQPGTLPRSQIDAALQQGWKLRP